VLPEEVSDFAAAFGLWRLAEAGQPLLRLATQAGRLRVARGADRALLDWTRIPDGGRVVLPRVLRPEWDADSLARALGEDAYLASRAIRLDVVDAKLFKRVGEDRIPAADLALRHDDPERAAWLEARLRELIADAGETDAIILGPWLGVDEAVADALSEKLGVVVGEVLTGVGGPAGLRFEAARDRVLEAAGVALEFGRVASIEGLDGGYVVAVEGEDVPRAADAVVLATGGVAAGGIVYSAPEMRAGRDAPDRGSAAFSLSLDAPVALRAQGRRLDIVSSLHGPALDEVAWPVDADPSFLEAIGVDCDARGAARPGLYVAGDAVGDAPRTVLEAVASGLRAAAAACA
jgi:glycerol-3-phosphate dehydrogenase subunit B